MVAALREHLGVICYIYLDDIIVFSNLVNEHTDHVQMILQLMRTARLWAGLKKCEFYKLQIDFLGHHISGDGVEACTLKVDKVLGWPVPKSATDICAFLGVVRYIAVYLLHLAEHAQILTLLTTKDTNCDFPEWMAEHNAAFEAIKQLVVGRKCLTVIDHEHPGENKIFVTCDASD